MEKIESGYIPQHPVLVATLFLRLAEPCQTHDVQHRKLAYSRPPRGALRFPYPLGSAWCRMGPTKKMQHPLFQLRVAVILEYIETEERVKFSFT